MENVTLSPRTKPLNYSMPRSPDDHLPIKHSAMAIAVEEQMIHVLRRIFREKKRKKIPAQYHWSFQKF